MAANSIETSKFETYSCIRQTKSINWQVQLKNQSYCSSSLLHIAAFLFPALQHIGTAYRRNILRGVVLVPAVKRGEAQHVALTAEQTEAQKESRCASAIRIWEETVTACAVHLAPTRAPGVSAARGTSE